MHSYEGKTSASIYREQLEDLVLCFDHQVTVRGRPTKELLNVVTTIQDPRARCQIVPGRRLNPWLALSESLWLLAGRNDMASLLPYNKGITEFSDNGRIMYGAYGWRTHNQIPFLLDRLKEDSADRRAVLSIWREEDLIAETKDPPCNDMVMFKLRSGKLHMTVINRSNDLHWGLHAVNLFQFGVLQEYIACRLGVDMGTQTHFSNSLHIYLDERAQKITSRMMSEIDVPREELLSDSWLFPNPFPEEVNHYEFANACGAVLDGTYDGGLGFPFLLFANDYLRWYRDRKKIVQGEWEGDDIAYSDMFPGWMIMAREHSPKLIAVRPS